MTSNALLTCRRPPIFSKNFNSSDIVPSRTSQTSRPLPEPNQLHGALADIFDALVVTLSDTRLEPDSPDLLWSVVNLFHRRIERIERSLDANECEHEHEHGLASNEGEELGRGRAGG